MQGLNHYWAYTKKIITVENLRKSKTHTFFLGFGLTQILLIFRDILTARTYGLSREFDSWMLILGGLTFVVAAMASGLSGFLVPRLQKFLLKNEWPKESLEIFKAKILKVFLFVLVILAGAQAFVLFYKVDQSPIGFILSGIIASYLSFQILFLRAQHQASLNVIGVSMTPSIAIFISILAMIFASINLGIYALVWGFIIGLIIELYTVYRLLKKMNMTLIPVSLPLVESQRDYWVYWQLAFAAALQGATLILDQMMTATMFGGGVAALTFGAKASGAVIAILGGFLQVVLFPNVARDYASSGIFTNISKKIFVVGLISISITIPLYLTAQPLVELLFLGGKFSVSDSEIVISLHKIFVLQLPFYLTGAIGVQMLHVLGRGKTMLLIGALALLLKVILNITLGKQLGILGFAWATVILYMWNFCLIWCLIIFRKK